MEINYKPKGVCAQQIQVTVEGDVIQSIAFLGGCHGNLQGIAALATGMNVSDVVAKLEGIRCGGKATSCPDQLCQALKAHMG